MDNIPFKKIPILRLLLLLALIVMSGCATDKYIKKEEQNAQFMETAKLKGEINDLKHKLRKKNNDLKDANYEVAQLKHEKESLQQKVTRLSEQALDEINPGEVLELKEKIEQLEAQNANLHDQLQTSRDEKEEAERRADRNQELSENLSRYLAQKNAEFQRLEDEPCFTNQHCTDQSTKVKKRYIEALMRLASYNAFAAIQNLRKLALKECGEPRREVLALQAGHFIDYYYHHIKAIESRTDLSLLSEVRDELKLWFQAGPSINLSQLKTLKHIQQDVQGERSGRLDIKKMVDKFHQRLPQYK